MKSAAEVLSLESMDPTRRLWRKFMWSVNLT